MTASVNICRKDKYVVIHDGFELMAWKDFMQKEKYSNVILDTHQYLMVAEANGCEQTVEAYVKYVKEELEPKIEEMEKLFPGDLRRVVSV